ncbi:MAG: hypothetical protein R3D25_10550 [Geminicoccaceae bacterium]
MLGRALAPAEGAATIIRGLRAVVLCRSRRRRSPIGLPPPAMTTRRSTWRSTEDGEKVPRAFAILGEVDLHDDGQRHAVSGWRQWSDLSVAELANVELVGDGLQVRCSTMPAKIARFG